MKVKLISVITMIIMCVMLTCTCVNADTVGYEDYYYMDKTNVEVAAGDSITVKLSLKSSGMVGALSVLEYDKNLKLEKVIKNKDISSENGIYSPQVDKNGNVSEENEIELNGKKRFVFAYTSAVDSIDEKVDFEIATLQFSVPKDVEQGTKYVIGLSKSDDETYIENRKGAKPLREAEDCIVTVVKSDYVKPTVGDDKKDDNNQNRS